MNDSEIKKVLAVLHSAFPNFQKGIDPKVTVNVWGSMFEDDDYNDTMLAVKVYIASEKFPPSIADIREKMVTSERQTLSADEAWGQVQIAFSKFGYPNEEEAMKWFHPDVAQLVKRLGWQILCRSQDLMADRAHFIRLWNAKSIQNQKSAMLPNSLKQTLELNWTKNDMNLAIETNKS